MLRRTRVWGVLVLDFEHFNRPDVLSGRTTKSSQKHVTTTAQNAMTFRSTNQCAPPPSAVTCSLHYNPYSIFSTIIVAILLAVVQFDEIVCVRRVVCLRVVYQFSFSFRPVRTSSPSFPTPTFSSDLESNVPAAVCAGFAATAAVSPGHDGLDQVTGPPL